MMTLPCFAFILTTSLCGLGFLRLWIGRWLPSTRRHSDVISMAEGQLSAGQLEAALNTLRPIATRRRSSLRAKVLYAFTLRSNQQHQEADQYCAQQQRHNSYPLLERERGKALLTIGKAAEALTCFQRCEELLDSEADSFDHAASLFLVGRYDEAWNRIQPFIANTRCGKLFALAGDCQFVQSHYEQATIYYLRAQTYGWQSHRLVLRMGYSLLECGHPKKAILYFNSLINDDNADVEATLGLGSCHERLGNFTEALQTYQAGAAWDCGDYRILHRAGVCAAYADQPYFAEIYLKGALKADQPEPEAIAFLGFSYERQRLWQQAQECYQELIRRFPEHSAGYRGIAWLFGTGQSTNIDAQTALQLAEKAVQLSDDDRSWELLSACEARAGNYARAHEIHERLSTHPADANTQQRRRNALRTLRRQQPLDERLVGEVMVA